MEEKEASEEAASNAGKRKRCLLRKNKKPTSAQKNNKAKEVSSGSSDEESRTPRPGRVLKPSLYDEFVALNQGTKKLGRLRECRTRVSKTEHEVPDSTLTFVTDIKPKYGANEFVAVNPEADSEEEFYLAQLREDVFAKVQSVVHVLWLDRAGAGKKSVWQFDEYDSVPCGSIICRVKLADGEDDTLVLSEAERQKVLTLKELDSEEEEAKQEIVKARQLAAPEVADEGEEAEADETASEGDEEEGEASPTNRKRRRKKSAAVSKVEDVHQKKAQLKKTHSKPQIIKVEEEEEKLLERLEKIEDPTFVPGKAVNVAHRGARRQAAKRSASKRVGTASGTTTSSSSRKRRKADDDDGGDGSDEGDEGSTKRPPKRARTAAPKRGRKGKRVGKLDKSVKKITADSTFDVADGKLRGECCTLCSSREAIRAVLSNDLPLLQAVATDSEFVHSLFVPRSVDVPLTCVEYAIKANNIAALKILVGAIKNAHQHKRARPTRTSLKTMDTGSFNYHTYNHAVRKVAASRGGKEGNNAFAADFGEYLIRGYETDPDEAGQLIKVILQCPEVQQATIEWLMINYPDFEGLIADHIYQAVYVGNRKLAGFFIEWFEKKGGWGFNFLHKQALLNDGKPFDQYKIQSVGKRPNGNHLMTPFHCAAINPNTKYLKELLAAKPEDRLADTIKRQPIHYAAACTGSDPLKLLLDRGVSHREVDREGSTSLMIAAQCGRLDSIKLLLDWDSRKMAEAEKEAEESDKEHSSDDDEEEEAPRKQPRAKLVPYIDTKSKGSRFTALHFAVRNNQPEAVKLLIEKGAHIEAPDVNRMTPLHHAVALGFVDVAKELVEAGCNIEAADKLKRTAVIHAARNGQLVALNYLLRMSAAACCADSSTNTAAHYAAAFGWRACLELLVENGADPNAPNDWKTTPLAIALQKGHLACADFLLEQPSVDVNIRDDDGRTLASQLMDIVCESSHKQLQYLIEKKSADVTTPDTKGLTPLHYVAQNFDPVQAAAEFKADNDNSDADSTSPSVNAGKDDMDVDGKDKGKEKGDDDKEEVGENDEPKKKKKKTWTNWSVVIAKMLIKHGADVNAQTKDKSTPLMLAKTRDNEELLILLLDNGAQIAAIHVQDRNVLHQLTPQLMERDLLPLLEAIARNVGEQRFKEMARELDDEGFTPFLRFVQHYGIWSPDHKAKVPSRTKQAPPVVNPEERRRQEKAARDRFRRFLVRFIELGAVDTTAPVRSTKAWRDWKKADPQPKQSPGKYSLTDGRRTALHFLVSQPDLLSDFIHEYKLDINAQDRKMETPLHLAINGDRQDVFNMLLAESSINANVADSLGTLPLHLAVNRQNLAMVDALLQANTDVDKWQRGRAALHTAVDCCNLAIINSLLRAKANVNIQDSQHKTPLHYALQRKNMNLVRILVQAGADVNASDNNGSSGLHYAVTYAEPGADASFEIEDFLLKKGANVNKRDNHGRVPLHYAFLKTGNQNTPIDPIETVSSLCAVRDLEIDVADNHKRTPLHYAAQRGATTCSLLLLNRKAGLENQDEDGNTPLGLGLKNGHGDYAIVLLQKNANVRHPIYNVTWGFAHDENQRHKRVITHSTSRSMFYEAVSRGWQGVSYMMLDAGLDKLTALTDAINTGKFQLVVTLLSKTPEDEVVQGLDADDRTLFHHLANYCSGKLDHWAQTLAEKLEERGVAMNVIDKHGRLPLHYASKNGCGVLVDFFLKRSKSDVNLIDENGKSPLVYAVLGSHLQVAERLMARKADCSVIIKNPEYEKTKQALDARVKQKNQAHGRHNTPEKKQRRHAKAAAALSKVAQETHLVIYAMRASLADLLNLLLANKADLNAKDSLGNTCLIYAVRNNDTDMVHLLFTKRRGAAKPGPSSSSSSSSAPPSSLSPAEPELMLENETGIDPNVQDEQGKTALHHVVSPLDYGSYENVALLTMLLKAGADPNVKDNQGHTPLYYALQQRDGVMAARLRSLGAKLDKKEEANLPRQASFVLSDQWISDYGIPPVDWEHDSAELLNNPPEPSDEEKAEQQEKAREKQKHAHPVDKNFDQRQNSEVYAENKGEVYDVTLTTVDVRYGTHGINNFYKMQVIHNKLKDFYILWTRWGRIGDVGQYQRTPFPTAEATVEEFKKIFKAKTGNSWEDRANFEKKPKKYHMIKLETNKEKLVANLLKPFDIELEDEAQGGGAAADAHAKPLSVASRYPPSKLPLSIQHAIKALTDSSMLTQAMQTEGIDTEAMPLGRLTRDGIDAAMQIIADLRKLIREVPICAALRGRHSYHDDKEGEEEENAVEEANAEADNGANGEGTKKKKKKKELTLEEMRELYEEIAELSNRFYELIPHAEYTIESIPPLNTNDLLNKKFVMLSNLAEIRTAAKILLGAHYRVKEINPLDYCYSAMHIRLSQLPKETDEYKILRQYIKRSSPSVFVTNIYHLQRKGEPERFQERWEKVPNHQLLFHGSALSNFVGILSQGLRIAPPEAPFSGYAFGKGIYFADMFQKSFGYCRMGHTGSRHSQPERKNTGFMLMCEVALGEMNAITQAEYMEKAPQGFHSTKGIGQRGPDPSKTIVVPSGVTIPVGEIMQYPKTPGHHYGLQHNEYIVYDTSQVRMRYLIKLSDKDPRRCWQSL